MSLICCSSDIDASFKRLGCGRVTCWNPERSFWAWFGTPIGEGSPVAWRPFSWLCLAHAFQADEGAGMIKFAEVADAVLEEDRVQQHGERNTFSVVHYSANKARLEALGGCGELLRFEILVG